MMEIKTAEQYVISELIEVKEQKAKLETDYYEILQKAEENEDKYRALCNQIRSHLSVRKSDNGQIILDFKESIWSEYDKAEYDMWISMFPELLDTIKDKEESSVSGS